MHAKSDARLLRAYADGGDDTAFGVLVARHTDLLYSAAIRQVESADLAKDIVQEVFVDLARKAGSVSARLDAEASLAGWLHRSTRYAALNYRRRSQRRLANERHAMEASSNHHSDDSWDQLAPVLDQALDSLGEKDREAILLRYFQKRDFHAVGRALGVSDDTAQKRVSRALDQLRSFLSKRGVTVGATAIVALLSANAVKAAPVGLALSISSAASLAGAATTTTAAVAASQTLIMTTLQKTIVGTVLAAAVGTSIYQTHQVSQLREQVAISAVSVGMDETGMPAASSSDGRAARSKNSRSSLANAPLSRARLEAELEQLATHRSDAYLNQLIADASLADIPALLAMVDKTLPPDLRRKFRDAWLDRWSAADPAAAFAYANTLKDKDEQWPAMESVFTNWAKQDVAAAAKAVEGLNGETKENAMKGVVAAWMLKDPESALKWGADHDLNIGYIGALVEDLAPSHPAEAWKWVKALPDEDGKDEYSFKQMMTLRVIGEVARSKPEEIATFVASLDPENKRQGEFATRVAGSWAASNPKAALEWVMAFTDPAMRGKALNAVASNWCSNDPAAATAWIRSLPEGSDRDEAALGYVGARSQDHPDEAAGMIDQMRESSLRDLIYWQLARQWLKRDPAAATQWLSRHGRSPEAFLNDSPPSW